MVGGATSELILTLLFEMLELMENRLYAYVDDSTLLAVVRKPANKQALTASLK